MMQERTASTTSVFTLTVIVDAATADVSAEFQIC